MCHYLSNYVVYKKKRKDGCSYFFLKNQAFNVTFLTLHYGKIKCHGFKTQDSRRVPIVKIERGFKNPIGTKNRRNCFIVRVVAEYNGSYYFEERDIISSCPVSRGL